MAFEGPWLLSSSLEEYTEVRASLMQTWGCFAAGLMFLLARSESDWEDSLRCRLAQGGYKLLYILYIFLSCGF